MFYLGYFCETIVVKSCGYSPTTHLIWFSACWDLGVALLFARANRFCNLVQFYSEEGIQFVPVPQRRKLNSITAMPYLRLDP